MKKMFFTILSILALWTPSLHSQYYFGRNKVIYNDFDWRIMQTEHFDIYYYPQMRELAETGAAYAEESYLFLENKFNHSIHERIPLIFYATHAHFQESNTISYLIPEGIGGFFEFLKGRVVVPANGSVAEFQDVLRHELVHVFTYSKVQRVLKNHKMTNHPGLPLWFMEGLAEYWSRGWNSEAEMFIRDAVINGYLFPVERIYQISGSFLMYKEGQAVLRYIATTYGDEKILQLIENVWMSPRFDQVMHFTLGVPLREFDAAWIYALKKEYYPLLTHEDVAARISEQITRRGINIKPAFYRADSEYVVFISNRTGYANIYLAPARKGFKEPKLETLVEGERNSEFESFHLLNSAIDVNDDGELVFVSKHGEKDVLYILDVKEKRVTEQFEFEELVSLFSPKWSADGSRIVFSGLAFSGRSDLYLFDRRSKGLQALLDDPFDDRDPVFSPDGRFLAFSSDRGPSGQHGYYNLFLYDLQTGRVRPLTHGTVQDLMPAWSPDGACIAFVSDRSGTQNIWSLPAPDVETPDPIAAQAGLTLQPPNSLKQVTSFVCGAYDPEWTPGGDLLFTVFENFSFNIYRESAVMQQIAAAPAHPSDTLAPLAPPWQYRRLAGSGDSQDIKYKPRFSLDIAQSQITQDPIFGTSGGAQLVVSDMLGNHQYFFLLYNTARSKNDFLSSFNFAVTRMDLSRRTHIATGLYHFAGQYYSRYDYWFWERRYGGYAALSYPLSKFKRIEANLNVRFSDKEWYATGYRRKALLMSNFVSYVKDNSLWGPSGPIDGTRLNVTVGNTLDIAHSNVNFITAIVDYRRYFRLSNQSAHALRIWTQMNHGKESTPFFMGGSWDLRGYGLWRLWGTKLALVSNELRFPFIDRFSLHFPFGGLAFSAIRGALFLDAGNAWENHLDNLLGSTGFGVRLRLANMLILRFDVGRKFELVDIDKFYQPGQYDFESAWFTQFFFGWDF